MIQEGWVEEHSVHWQSQEQPLLSTQFVEEDDLADLFIDSGPYDPALDKEDSIEDTEPQTPSLPLPVPFCRPAAAAALLVSSCWSSQRPRQLVRSKVPRWKKKRIIVKLLSPNSVSKVKIWHSIGSGGETKFAKQQSDQVKRLKWWWRIIAFRGEGMRVRRLRRKTFPHEGMQVRRK